MSQMSLLARETNWMETQLHLIHHRWQRSICPYSLGKLIEWKLETRECPPNPCTMSLLARETNWMETEKREATWATPRSLLARETNWMETAVLPIDGRPAIMSLLARETNWMETAHEYRSD